MTTTANAAADRSSSPVAPTASNSVSLGPSVQSAKDLSDTLASLAKEGRHEEAGVVAAQLLTLRPGHRRALRALFRNPQPGIDMIEAWSVLSRAEPNDDEVHAKLSRLHFAAGDLTAALASTQTALALNPENIDALETRLRTLIQLEACESIGSAWQDLYRVADRRAITALKRGVADKQANYDVRSALLGAAASQSALDGEDQDMMDHLRALSLASAYAAEVSGKRVEAAIHFLRLTWLDSTEAEFKSGLERTQRKLSEMIERAVTPTRDSTAAADALVKIMPHDLDARRHLIESAKANGEWHLAAQSWGKYFESGGEQSIDNLVSQLEALARSGDVAGCAEPWRALRANRATGLAEKLTQTQAFLFAHCSATFGVAMDGLHWHDARTALERAIFFEAPDGAVDRMRKRFLSSAAAAAKEIPEEDLAARLELLRHQHAIGLTNVSIAIRLGRTLMRERHYAEALPVWLVVAELQPDDIEPWLQLTRCSRKTGNSEQAVDFARKVLALDPEHAEAKAVVEEFAALVDNS
jgi:tetratricopeptide (TPR) repeat protein